MKTVYCTLVLAAALTSQAQFANRGGFNRDRLKQMHRTVDQFVRENQHAGIITLLAHNGRIVDVQTYGYRDLEQQLPMERDTICRIYSMSKIITSVGVLILLEDGRFSLDDPVSRYLPELKDMKVFKGGTADAPQLAPASRPVTIKHLLTHTSGLIYDFQGDTPLIKMYRAANLWNGPGLDDFIRKVGQLPLQHEPGAQFTYGINTDVLGALIERVSGKRFGEFLAERIFEPLGMKDTAFDVPESKMNRLAKTYEHGPEGKLVEAEPLIETWPESGRGIESGGAGLFSTVDDYARFALMLMDNGSFEGKRILGRKTIELMTANHLVTLPEAARAGGNPAQGFGLGVEVQLDLGYSSQLATPGAFGWYGAATTYARIDPREQVVAIAFAQHFPFNEHGFFARFGNGYYQALK